MNYNNLNQVQVRNFTIRFISTFYSDFSLNGIARKALLRIHWIISKSAIKTKDTARNIYVDKIIMRDQQLKMQNN